MEICIQEEESEIKWKWGTIDNNIIFFTACFFFFLKNYYSILDVNKNKSYKSSMLTLIAYIMLFIFQIKNKWLFGTILIGILLIFNIIYVIKIYLLKNSR